MSIYENLNGINFSVGPVHMDDETKAIGSSDSPYFRTKEFSDITFENETLIKKMVNASSDSRIIL